MSILKTLAASTAIAAMATTSVAGGLSDQIMEAPVVAEEAMAPAGSSIDPALIVLGILGLLVLGASSSSGTDDGGEDKEPSCDPLCDTILLPSEPAD